MSERIPDQVLLANPRGTCIGVDRMIEHVEERLAFGEEVNLLGKPTHNDDEVERLVGLGAKLRRRDELELLDPGTPVVFTAHGTAPDELQKAEDQGLLWSNGVCPFVTKVQRAAKDAVNKGSYVVDISKNGHPEQLAVLGVAPEKIYGVETVEQARELVLPEDFAERGLVVVNQTTMSTVDTAETRAALLERFPFARVLEGICYATDDRQEAVRYLSRFVDLGIVVTGEESHNGRMLGLTFEQSGIPSRFIRNWRDLTPAVHSASRIGLTSSASTPERIFQEVVSYFRQLGVSTIEERGVAKLIEREKNIRFAPVSRNPKVVL